MISLTTVAPGPSSPSINARLTATHRRITSSSRSLHSDTWLPSGSNVRSRHRSSVPTALFDRSRKHRGKTHE